MGSKGGHGLYYTVSAFEVTHSHITNVPCKLFQCSCLYIHVHVHVMCMSMSCAWPCLFMCTSLHFLYMYLYVTSFLSCIYNTFLATRGGRLAVVCRTTTTILHLEWHHYLNETTSDIAEWFRCVDISTDQEFVSTWKALHQVVRRASSTGPKSPAATAFDHRKHFNFYSRSQN